MDVHQLPRTAVRLTIVTARMPLTAAETLLGHRRDEGWAPALAFDQAQGRAKDMVGTLLRDEELAGEGRLILAKVDKLRQAGLLEALAESRREQADAELVGARERASHQRKEARTTEAVRKQQGARTEAAAKKRAEQAAARKRAAAEQATDAAAAVAAKSARRQRTTALAKEQAAIDTAKAARARKRTATNAGKAIAASKRTRSAKP